MQEYYNIHCLLRSLGDFDKQVKAVRVEFFPERTKLSSGKAYTHAFVDSDDLDWIELPPIALRHRQPEAARLIVRTMYKENQGISPHRLPALQEISA